MQKKNVNPHFDISRLDSLPKIEIVYMYVDASAIAINAFINDKTEGLIIAGVAADSHYPQKARILLIACTYNYHRPKHNTGNVSKFLMNFKN